MHSSNADLMLVLDAGSLEPCIPEDGRLFTLDIPTGDIGVTIGTGNGLTDPQNMKRDPISGDVFIADPGCLHVVGDGTVYRWNGSQLSVVISGIEARGLCFLDDGTYYLNGAVDGVDAMFHMSGSTVLQTVAQGFGRWDTISVHDGTVGMPAGVYTSGEQGLFRLTDTNGDFVADQIVLIANEIQGIEGFGRFVFDSFGRILTVDDATRQIVAVEICPGADGPAPTMIMREPFAPNDGPITNPEGVNSTRLAWSSQVEFTDADLSILDSLGQPVPFSVLGSGSAIMQISFGATLINNVYTVTISDTVHSLAGTPIDGDDDGIAGGNAVFELTHATCFGGQVPAVSEWGVAAMALLLIVAGTIVFMKGRPLAA